MSIRGALLVAALPGVFLSWATPATAVPLGGDDDESGVVEAHGFISQGLIKTTGNNYLAKSKEGSFDFTEVGINFTTHPTERLRLGVQLFANKLGATGDFNAKADWFYLDYRWRDWFGIRAGRVKLPFGLYNDTSDIDAARVPVLLPQSVYPINNRNYLLAQTGVELYGYVNLRAAGALDYRLYGGTISIALPPPTPSVTPPPRQTTELRIPFVLGGRLLWDTPLQGLRLGGSLQVLRIDFAQLFAMTVAMPPTETMPEGTPAKPAAVITGIAPVVLWVASLEYAAHDWLLAAEYSRWYLKVTDSSDPTRLSNATLPTSERAYAMTAYRVRRWFQPGVHYAFFFPDVNKRSGPGVVQHDFAGTLRFDINDHWLVKLEGHYMHGVAGVSPALNNNLSGNALAQDWVVLFLKTTAYF